MSVSRAAVSTSSAVDFDELRWTRFTGAAWVSPQPASPRRRQFSVADRKVSHVVVVD